MSHELAAATSLPGRVPTVWMNAPFSHPVFLPPSLMAIYGKIKPLGDFPCFLELGICIHVETRLFLG